MTSRILVALVAVGLALSTAGCDKIQRVFSGGQAKGQVVATVSGKEITELELRSEMGGFSSRDSRTMNLARQQGLQQIILRRVLAEKAKELKLDKTEMFNLQVQRGIQTLLSDMYESRIAQGVVPPTRDEAERYVAAHPAQFAERRIYILDVIVAPGSQVPRDKVLPLKNMAEIKAFLDRYQIPFQESVAAVDTLTATRENIDILNKLPPGEIFIVPEGAEAISFNHIYEVRSAPFRGSAAINYAMSALRGIQLEDFVHSRIVVARQAAEPNVVYGQGLKPANGPLLPPVGSGGLEAFRSKPGPTPVSASPPVGNATKK